MAKQTATTKQTSGAGFGFEDKVAAHFATWMLVGASPFYPRLGQVTKVEFQKRVDKHLLDDIVLTLANGAQTWQCSLSVKSNVQFTTTSAPAPFVEALWEMYLHIGTDCFVLGRDTMGLVTATLPQPVRAALLRDLLPKARQQEPDVLASRLTSGDPDAKGYCSDDARALFRSFACPTAIAPDHSANTTTTADLLRHVVVMDFDFGSDPSADEPGAVERLGRMLETESMSGAASLWNDLLAIVRRENENGGFLDRQKLLSDLRPKHMLKAFPDHRADWMKLITWGRDAVESVPDAIGGTLRLHRSELLTEARAQIDDAKYCGIIGPSGSGKSVLTKRLAAEIADGGPILWFAAEEFTSRQLDGLPSRLQLGHSLSQMLDCLPNESGVVVLDGLERLASDDAWLRLRRLLSALGVRSQTSSWLVIFSCQSERWEYVQGRLIRLGLQPHSLPVIQLEQGCSDDELERVAESFPNLRHVLVRPHLQELLRRPKVLDILAAHSVQMGSAGTANWAGESDLINWYWTSVIDEPDDGPARSTLVQLIGERQADHDEPETPLTELAPAGLDAIRGLQRDGVCHNTRSNHVRFAHDLIADWCRQRVLIAHERDLGQYLAERVLNPNWHRAIRLYGLHLIEGAEDVHAWANARSSLPSVGDLLLDSVIFAANARDLLERLWPLLTQCGGDLLRRLLRRFLHVATYPDPVAVWMGEHSHQDIAGLLRATWRKPLWPYWLSVLPFLHSHKQEVVALAALEVANVANTWLRYGGQKWIYRREAAELAVAVGDATWLARLGHQYRSDKDDERRYEAALAAASELPDEVADLALRAAARKLPPGAEDSLGHCYRAPGAPVRVHTGFIGHTQMLPQPQPWPDGPSYRVDDAFQKACLSGAALLPLMALRPAVAAEVILALVIESRRPRLPYDSSDRLSDHVGLDFLPQFSPPLYDKGPFWSFLRTQPDSAVDCIIRLVDFASARWLEVAQRGSDSSARFEVAGPDSVRVYSGDSRSCGWYRGAFAPAVVASALMAMEHWLYEQLKQGNSVERVCSTILDRSHSNAFLALLWEVGRSEPTLFKGPLRPLLTCAALHWWEVCAIAQGLDRLGLIGLPMLSERSQKEHLAWEGLPHRTLNVHSMCLRLFLFDPSMAKIFDIARQSWEQQRNLPGLAPEYVEYLQSLLLQFDRANWREAKDESGRAGLQYVLPAEIVERPGESDDQDAQSLGAFHHIVVARQWLDGESCLDPAQLSVFLEQTQTMVEARPDDKEHENYRVAALLGGIAALANLQWDWLAEQPERLSWCRESLLDVLAAPRSAGEFWSERDKSRLSWEDFAAEALVPFWVHTPHDPAIRHAVAEAVMSRHYSAVTLLTHRAFVERGALGQSFLQLISFVLSWAVKRDEIQWAARRDAPVDVDAWFAVHGRQFIEGTTPTGWGSWAEQAVQDGHRVEVGPRDRFHELKSAPTGFVVHPCIDVDLIGAALAGILRLPDAKSEDERAMWLGLWRQVVLCVTAPHKVRGEDGEPILSSDLEVRDVEESDYWAARRISELMLDMRPDEHPQQVMRSIVDLERFAHQCTQ